MIDENAALRQGVPAKKGGTWSSHAPSKMGSHPAT